MNLRSAAVTVGGMLLAAAAVLWLFERQISGPWFRLGLHPEITAAWTIRSGWRASSRRTGTSTELASRPPRRCSTTCASWSTTASGSPVAGS